MSRFKDKYNQQPGEEYRNPDEELECWASDSGSSSGSYYSNSSSSPIEWESEISPGGEVFYIESLMESLSLSGRPSNPRCSSPKPELARRRSTRAGKLIRLIKRKESYRHSVRMSGLASELKRNHESISRVKKEQANITENFESGDKYSIGIHVDPDKRHKLGRRATLCEAYLGIVPRAALDKKKVIVAGFVPDGEAFKKKEIRVGDWLQSVNDKEVDIQSLNGALAEFSSPTIVTCQFQRSCLDGRSSPAVSCPAQSLLARQLVDKEESQILMDLLIKEPLGVVCARITEFSDGDTDMQGVLYTFPRSKSKSCFSFLSSTKGAFITLNHLLADVIGQRPVSTTVMTSTGLTYVIYFTCEEELLLISIPEKCCSKQEAIELSLDIMCTLAFTHESIAKCFAREDNHPYLDHLFYQFFSRLYKDKLLPKKITTDAPEIRQCDFDFLLPAANYVQLPRDAQIQIDAALSEMEAMDYRDWNQDPLECQRLYTILGSCLYHKKYLLGSHLPSEDLIQVHSFLRRHGLINLINTEQVKSIVVWKRIYPSSGVNREVCSSTDQWFLLVVGYAHDLLAVILESGGCTAILEENYGPDIFYVEEAQETLKHIRKIGISMLAEKWINSNAKPEVVYQEKEASSKVSSSITGFIKSSQFRSSSTFKTPFDGTSTIKSRTSEDSRTELNTAFSFETSRDSPSQDSLSQVSEVSDQTAPVLGRRAAREKINVVTKFSEDSDSDFDDDSTGITDISNIRENLLNQAEYIVPKIVTTGEKNYLVYYVSIDLFQGHLISSKINHLDQEFLSLINSCCQKIHKLLSDTKRYKKLLSHETGKSVINKSLIAIKEHGILFEWDNCTYWVVGRLFTTPRPKELYICYEDCTPQNLIEMSYRLNLTNN